MIPFNTTVAAILALLALPAMAEAAVRGHATTDVNMRSGPSTAYPAVTVVPYGALVTINGCLTEANWCDVTFTSGRGWVHGRYLETSYRSRPRHVAPGYYRPIGVPLVEFEQQQYWTDTIESGPAITSASVGGYDWRRDYRE